MQISNRNSLCQQFTDKQILYLLYIACYGASIAHDKNCILGDVRPQNVIMSYNGDIYLCCPASFVDSDSAYMKAFSTKTRGYLAPEQIQDLRNGRESPLEDQSVSQDFSVGLTVLSAIVLENLEKMYGKDYSFDGKMLERQIKKMRAKSYNTTLKNLVQGLLQIQPKKRLTSQQVIQILKPYEQQIINLEEFYLQNPKIPSKAFEKLSHVRKPSELSKVINNSDFNSNSRIKYTMSPQRMSESQIRVMGHNPNIAPNGLFNGMNNSQMNSQMNSQISSHLNSRVLYGNYQGHSPSAPYAQNVNVAGAPLVRSSAFNAPLYSHQGYIDGSSLRYSTTLDMGNKTNTVPANRNQNTNIGRNSESSYIAHDANKYPQSRESGYRNGENEYIINGENKYYRHGQNQSSQFIKRQSSQYRNRQSNQYRNIQSQDQNLYGNKSPSESHFAKDTNVNELDSKFNKNAESYVKDSNLWQYSQNSNSFYPMHKQFDSKVFQTYESALRKIDEKLSESRRLIPEDYEHDTINSKDFPRGNNNSENNYANINQKNWTDRTNQMKTSAFVKKQQKYYIQNQ